MISFTHHGAPGRPGRNDPDSSARMIGLALGGLLPIALCGLLVPLRAHTSGANLAVAMVLPVVVAAAQGGRLAGISSAVVSALAFDFFLTRPYLSLTIASRDDVETTVLLLIVGIVVGTLATRASRGAREAGASRDELLRIRRLAELVAQGGDVDDVVAAGQAELAGLLGLRDCWFESDGAVESRPRLERSGTITGAKQHRWAGHAFEMPIDGVELAVSARGTTAGRYVLLPTQGVGVSLEQRVVAVALADQVGAALATRSSTP